MLNIAVALRQAFTAAIANGGVRTIFIALQTSCLPHFPIGYKNIEMIDQLKKSLKRNMLDINTCESYTQKEVLLIFTFDNRCASRAILTNAL